MTDPWGSEWELYISRVEMPDWKEDQPVLDGVQAVDGAGLLLEIPIMVAGFLWSSIIFPLLRFALLTPFAVVKGRRSHAAQIEAICFYPARETRTWTTTLDQAESVANQIALGIEEGKVVQPIGAVYVGSKTDS